MARNKLADLNDHLFAQLERLNDEDLTDEKILAEVKRATAISKVASQIIKNAEVTLEAVKLVQFGDLRIKELPESFGLNQTKIS